MVKICDSIYKNDNQQQKYDDIFEQYPFELDHFQKYAIQAIEEKKHILITSHTGSGKTLPSEFAIGKFCTEGKKVIYTSPIKSLSNQKFYEFTDKFPEISFGIMTGDIKFNPDADCLIMTTEILRNTLFQKEMLESCQDEKEKQAIHDTLSFNIDIQNDLACVIFDEIHYINDADRGKVWEETIMKLPKQVQMVMLSATIDKKEQFAQWIESIKERDVWIASTDVRVVPLQHYSYFITNKHILKNVKDKKMELLMKETNDELQLLKSTHTPFNNENVLNLNKINSFMFKSHFNVSSKETLNRIVKKLFDNDMLPAICFVFSRKNVELFASQIESTLFRDDETNIIQTIEKECKHILQYIPNHKEYFELPEFTSMVRLMEKGIAIHHSGVMPILREMVEIMFSKGYIKLLFATETFSVGINMPTKTVLFTSLLKYDGSGMRYLLPHEYTQMAGRAGRRGLDKKGYVIHLNNMFEVPTLYEYKQILSGVPQTLLSKFQANSNLVLKMIANQENTIDRFISFGSSSFYHQELKQKMDVIDSNIVTLQNDLQKYKTTVGLLKTSCDDMKRYKELEFKLTYSKQKQRKKLEREMKQLRENNLSFIQDYKTYCIIYDIQKEIEKLEKDKLYYDMYHSNKIKMELLNLETNKFIETINNTYSLTLKGQIASQIQEVNCLVLSEMIQNDMFRQFDVDDLCALFSCFSNIRVSDEKKCYLNTEIVPKSEVLYTYKIMYDRLNYYYNIELKKQENGVNTDEYKMIFDLIEPVYKWCNATNEIECKAVIQMLYEKGIFLGEFIKAILKINNIADEMKKVAIFIGNVKLQQMVSSIPERTLKYVATNDSLYI